MGESNGPFLGSASGLSKHELRFYRRLHRNVYVHRRACATAESRARAAWLWLGENGVLAGLSAAALHGSKWVDSDRPAHALRRENRGSVPGIDVHSDSLLPGEVVILRGMRVTSAARTAFDLGRWLEHDDAIEQIDALCNAAKLTVGDVLTLARNHPGARGLRQLRSVLRLVDGGAESPAETRTRLVLIRAGLPQPSTQVRVYDERGALVARCDLGWDRWRVVVEYDGDGHWSSECQRTRDIRRYRRLGQLGWRVIRVNSELLRTCPEELVENVRAELGAAGAEL